MTFFVPHAPSHAASSRQDRIAVRYPGAASAIQRIEESIKSYSYGESVNLILNHYHFVPRPAGEVFFRSYLERRSGAVPSDAAIAAISKYAINMLDNDAEASGQFKVDRQFQRVFESTMDTVRKNDARQVPTLQFILGPTGAGKTIFSKYFFTVNLNRFWQNAVIPTRIEYSRIANPNGGRSISEEDFYSYARECLFRDTVIYIFLSGCVPADKRRAIVENSHTDPVVNESLSALDTLTMGVVLDGSEVFLSTERRNALHGAWSPIPKQLRDQLLYKWASDLKLTFLMSFDGFDCVRIEDFLFAEDPPTPVRFLSKMLKALHEKRGGRQLVDRPMKLHFLVYLRDATFERLRSALFTKISGEIKFPIYWIVPPKYESLVSNVSQSITKTDEQKPLSGDDTSRAEKARDSERKYALALADQFTSELFAAFDKHIFAGTPSHAVDHMGFVFGSNARRMNEHIRQTFLSMLWRASLATGFNFDRSGVGIKALWEELIEKFGPSHLPRYVLYEDLFLGDTRQLKPKLNLNPTEIGEILSTLSVEKAMSKVEDIDETNSIFGCLLNYAVPGVVTGGGTERPAMLILVRIIQFIDFNPRCRAGEIWTFLRKSGYESWTEASLQFCLYILIRTELVKWDGTTTGRSIRDVPLYVSTRGVIAIRKILYSASYLSEAIISCLHNERAVTDNLLPRVDDGSVWAMDCVYNALLAIELFREIETIESEAATHAGVDFRKYQIVSSLSREIGNEARAIVSSAFNTSESNAIKRWLQNERSLEELRGGRFRRIPIVRR
jgi:hypothetical protein